MAQDQIGINLTLSSEVSSGVAGVKQMSSGLDQLGQAASAASNAAAGAAKGIGIYTNSIQDAAKSGASFIASVKDGSLSFSSQGSAAQSAAKGIGIYNDAVRSTTAATRTLQQQAKDGQLAFVSQSGAAINAGRAINTGYVPALSALRTKSNSAGSAMIDLSRIVQDAPFGFIAIQNNISPLLESFTRVTTAAGGFGAGLKLLAGSLLGPAGIGLAVAAVTSGITLFVQHQQQAKKAVKETEDAIKSLVDINNDLVGSVSKSTFAAENEVAQLNRLIKVAADETQSRATRTAALKTLQEATHGYLDALTLETVGTEAARKSLDLFNQSLFQSALITAYKGKIEELGKSYADNEEKAAKLRTEIDALRDQYNKAGAAADALAGKTLPVTSVTSGAPGAATWTPAIQASKDLNATQKELNDKTVAYNKILADQNALKQDSLGISTKIADLSTAVQPFTKDANKTVKDGTDSIKEQYTAIQDLTKVFGSSKLVVDSFWYALGDKTALKNSTNTVLGITDSLPKIDDSLSGYAAEAQAKIQAMIKPVIDTAKEAKISLNSALSSAFSGLGESIGKALAGGGLQEAFKGVLNVFATFIKQIGESLIAAGTAMIAAKLLIKNPVTAIAAGVAAVAISSLLQAKISASLPRYATGGIAIGEQLAIVGDNPSGREAIIPSEDFDKLGGGAFIADTRISGNDLLILFKRAMSEEKRIN